MESKNSLKKVEGLNSIINATNTFLGDMQEATKNLNASCEEVSVRATDKLYGSVVEINKSINEIITEASVTISKLATTYAERKGFGAELASMFEEVASAAKSIEGNLIEIKVMEEHAVGTENVSEETIGAVTKALMEIKDVRLTYINKIAEIAGEYSTSDTQEIFEEIGGGLESITNALCNAINDHKDILKQFGFNVEEAVSEIKKTSSNFSSGSEGVKASIASADADLD